MVMINIDPHERGLLSQKEMAELVGIPPSSFSTKILLKKIPAPTEQLGRRLFYRKEQVEELRKLIEEVK